MDDFEKDIYTLCSYAQLQKQAEMISRLISMMPRPHTAPICTHDDGVESTRTDKEKFIDYFYNKYKPKP